MQQYLDLLQTIKEKGTIKEEARKGMPGTISLFGHQLRHNLKDGFPLLTTKKLSWNNIVVELLSFLPLSSIYLVLISITLRFTSCILDFLT